MRQATGPPRSGAGVADDMLRGYNNISWTSERFKHAIFQKYKAYTPMPNYSRICDGLAKMFRLQFVSFISEDHQPLFKLC